MMKIGLTNIARVFAVSVVMLLLASCGGAKKFVYLNDMTPGEKYPVNLESATIVHPNDRLDIKVTCKNPELAVPFNAMVGSYQVAIDGSVSSEGADQDVGYRVDSTGDIIFPVLGKINVGGKTLKEIAGVIETMIEEGDYIRDPEVSIEFLNFKYTVLGAVGSKGTFTVDGDRITLIEAIAKAGDLTNNARLDRVAVIRMVDGNQEIFYNDITTADVFMSPTYYLQQNDIVYVEPKHKPRTDNVRQNVSFAMTLVSLLTSMFGVLSWTGVIGG